MGTARPPGRGCGSLRRWLLGAALLLGLRLCVELRRAGSGPPARRAAPAPRPPHLLPAPGPPRGASRRQVTYVRSGRRALPRGGGSVPPEPSCCPRRKGPRWHIELQPWAGPAQSLDEEAWRFLNYISTTQIACDHMGTDSLAADSSPAKKPWLVCLDDRFGLAHQIRSKQCRLYSLGLGNDDTHFEVSMAKDGCEVHRFDPSVKSAHVLESKRLWHHRLSIDWRDPHPAVAAQRPHSNTRKLRSILNEFGHHKKGTVSMDISKLASAEEQKEIQDKVTSTEKAEEVKLKIDVLKADLESAEWKVLENLILEDVLKQIGQLIFEIHLHWPGFEVSGEDSSVVRFWYSLLKELERKDFRLFTAIKTCLNPSCS